jgi:uncharacterized protein YbbC (DUF1343 family)
MRNFLLGSDKTDEIYKLCKGKRCGLLTSASGVDSYGVPTYIKLHSLGCLSVLFSPEHGIHSVLQDGAWSGEYIDKETGVPVYDLKSNGNPNISQALAKCDVVLYDIQDVGARFYTYVYCLTYLMKECAARNIPVCVLDRPNPISCNLSKAEGPILDEIRYSSSIGRYAIPTRYSLTVGEFAKYINSVKNIGCELSVISCENLARDHYWDELGLPWINPSPNIPSVHCSINYIGTCLIEATNVSEGRGTTRPFDIIGAPFIDSKALCDELNAAKLDGVVFSRAFFTPMFGKFKNEACEGVQLNITDRASYQPYLAGLYILGALSRYSEFILKRDSLALRHGNDILGDCTAIDYNAVIEQNFASLSNYSREVQNYLLY